MDSWYDRIVDQWHLITAAKKGVLPLVIVVSGGTWWISGLYYSERIAVKDERLEQAQERIEQLEATQGETIMRDDNALYQDRRQVAAVQNPQIDAAGQTIVFPVVTSPNELDMSHSFEFREWELICNGASTGSLSFGAFQQINYQNIMCRITGNR